VNGIPSGGGVQADAACKARESALEWSVQGPSGPAGAQGPKGDQGAQGPQGPAGAGGAAAAEPNQRLVAYLQVKGQRVGVIKGDDQSAAHKDWIDVLGFAYAVVSPRDAATGQATGKRQHEPLVITKAIDKSTPLLFQALVTNENLPEVTIEFYRPQANGTESLYYKIKLTNATISSLHQSDEGKNGLKPYETLELVFQKIETTWTDGGITASDDWSSSNA